MKWLNCDYNKICPKCGGELQDYKEFEKEEQEKKNKEFKRIDKIEKELIEKYKKSKKWNWNNVYTFIILKIFLFWRWNRDILWKKIIMYFQILIFHLN